MNKSLLLFTSFSFFSTHPMEQLSHDFSIQLYGTVLNINKKHIRHIAHKVDLIILGKHEQQLLNHHHVLNKYYQPGITTLSNQIFYKDPANESDSDDETYKPFTEENRKSLFAYGMTKQPDQTIIEITEPCIPLEGWLRDTVTDILTPHPSYNVERVTTDGKGLQFMFLYGDPAITEASKDLALCYDIALHKGVKEKCKTIGITTLSADVGFPREKATPIAMSRITHFIRNNPDAYERIELCIKKRSELKSYKQFLINYWQKPCLLYCAHKDENHFLYNIPGDVIHCILQLMHPYTNQ